MAFCKAVSLDELWRGDMTRRVVNGTKVLVIRIDDAVYAYEDRCVHLGAALSEGALQGDVLTCSAHHHTFHARTGQGINPRSACLRVFAVEISEGNVLVDVADPEPVGVR